MRAIEKKSERERESGRGREEEGERGRGRERKRETGRETELAKPLRRHQLQQKIHPVMNNAYR